MDAVVVVVVVRTVVDCLRHRLQCTVESRLIWVAMLAMNDDRKAVDENVVRLEWRLLSFGLDLNYHIFPRQSDVVGSTHSCGRLVMAVCLGVTYSDCCWGDDNGVVVVVAVAVVVMDGRGIVHNLDYWVRRLRLSCFLCVSCCRCW